MGDSDHFNWWADGYTRRSRRSCAGYDHERMLARGRREEAKRQALSGLAIGVLISAIAGGLYALAVTVGPIVTGLVFALACFISGLLAWLGGR